MIYNQGGFPQFIDVLCYVWLECEVEKVKLNLRIP
jgi:hypothetical protein